MENKSLSFETGVLSKMILYDFLTSFLKVLPYDLGISGFSRRTLFLVFEKKIGRYFIMVRISDYILYFPFFCFYIPPTHVQDNHFLSCFDSAL